MNRTNLQVPISRTRVGFSYIEVIISAVIISVLLVAGLRLFGMLGRSQAAANEMEIAAHLAVELIEEITERNYADRSSTNVFGPGPAEVKLNRTNLQVPISRGRGGFSYIEVIISAVIISVLLVAGLRLFGMLGRSQAAANEMEIAAHLAVELIEEIAESNYADPSNTNVFGPEPAQVGPDRTLYDDVDDFHNWSASPPLDHFGQPFTQYGDFTRSVEVQYVEAADFSLTTGSDEGFKEVVVTVSRNGRELTRQTYIIADTDNP